MGAAALPFNINNGDPLDATQVMANDQAITQVVNGGLEANTNVSTDTAVTQTGAANGEGTAATLARSDHRHLIQGFENLAADPTTGNFKGRVYWNTVNTVLRYCTDASGVGTFLDLTASATSLVVHGAQHKDGGHDPLPDNILTDHMFAAKGTIFSATLGSDHLNISGTSFSTIVDLSVTTTGLQTLGITVNMSFSNHDSTDRNVGFRVLDVTASNTTIYSQSSIQLPHGSGTVPNQVTGFFFYTTPATGARTLRVQAGCSTASAVDVLQANAFSTETLAPFTVQAVIL